MKLKQFAFELANEKRFASCGSAARRFYGGLIRSTLSAFKPLSLAMISKLTSSPPFSVLNPFPVIEE
jgi:hypothetical protein